MSIAVIVAAALAAAASPVVNRTAPPIVIDLDAVSDVSPSLVAIAIAETDAVFRGAGVRFIWRRGASRRALLHVSITNESGPARGNTPLGWLVFEDDVPGHEIHLSYGNAKQYLEESREVVGSVFQKTIAEREMLIGRALGRALAHELGHYLLATKQHSSRGLMKGARTAHELFSLDRSGFAIERLDRLHIAARVSKESDVASRD